MLENFNKYMESANDLRDELFDKKGSMVTAIHDGNKITVTLGGDVNLALESVARILEAICDFDPGHHMSFGEALGVVDDRHVEYELINLIKEFKNEISAFAEEIQESAQGEDFDKLRM